MPAIIKVADGVTDARIRRFLPPDHRIAAVRPMGDRRELLIEGPMLPKDQTVEAVLLSGMTALDFISRDNFQVIASWLFDGRPDPAGRTWEVGIWPSAEAFSDEMAKLDENRRADRH